MKKPAFWLTALFLNLIISATAAAEVTVELKLDRAEATPADSVQLVVRISGIRSSSSPPNIPGLENFSVDDGGTSSRVEIINGQVSASLDYTYFIQAQKAGIYQIGPAEVRIEGRKYRSNPVTLQVIPPAQGQDEDRGPLFLSAGLSSATVYVEQQAVYTLKLFRRLDVKDLRPDLPQTDDLVFKQLAKPIEYRSTYNGRSYRVLEVRYVVLPFKAGRYSIEPAKMRMTVLQSRRNSRRSLFDDRFFSFATGRPVTISSQPLELEVRPLPQEGKTPDFSGLVGSFQIESKLDPTTIKTGESATLTVSVSGRGNVNRIPDLKIPELSHIKVYDDQPVLTMQPDSGGLAATKIMKWALVPEKDGRLEVPALRLSYFDPQARQYKTLKTSPYTLEVAPGKPQQVAASAEIPGAPATSVKQAVKELGRDILPIHTAIRDFGAHRRLQLDKWVLGVLLALPLGFYLLALGTLKWRRQSEQSAAEARARKAARNFIRQFGKRGVTAGDLLEGFRDYLNHRYGLSFGSLTPEEASEILIAKGAGEATARRLQRVIGHLENAVYTGQARQEIEVGENLVQLINKIEKESR